MGIDFVLDHSCTPKRELGAENLVELCKAKSRAEAVLAMVRDQGDQRAPEAIEIEVMLQTPDGVEEQTVTVQELIERAAPLERLRSHCAGCPVNGDSPGYGCYRSIAYPIPEAAETWLLGLLPDDLDTTAGKLLVRAIEDFDWDGHHAAEMRAHGDTFFECREALAVRWGEGEDEVQIDSDQLFHMLFHVGPVGSTHAFMVCLFFGIVPHDLDLDALTEPGARAAALAQAAVPQPPLEACEGLAQFLHALVTAARLDCDVLVDG